MTPRFLLSCALLGAALVSCGQGSNTATSPNLGGLPSLPTGIAVRFDAAPESTYLTLSTDLGNQSEVVYQKAVPKGATTYTPDLNDWRKLSSKATGIALSNGTTTAPLLFLKWGMYQDKNGNAQPDEGEWLDRMTHDRVVYAEKAVRTEFDSAGPDMHQTWEFIAGWSRAEHYVYLPLEKGMYQRFSRSTPLWDFWLHTATPITSM